MKIILGVALAILVLIAAFYALNSYIYNEKQGEPENREQAQEPPLGEDPRYAASDFIWKMEPSSRYKETMPWKNVSLTVGGKTYPLGESLGCDETDIADGSDTAGPITMLRCWYGGGGEDFTVFEENGIYLVKKRWTSESGGPAVQAPPLGPYETILVID